MAAKESTKLFTEYKVNRYSAKQYMLSTASLHLNEANIGLHQCKYGTIIGEEIYSYNVTVEWDSKINAKAYATCASLEKEIAALLDTTKNIIPLIGEMENVYFIHAVTKVPKTDKAYTHATNIQIQFPSIEVYPDNKVIINAVLTQFTLDYSESDHDKDQSISHYE